MILVHDRILAVDQDLTAVHDTLAHVDPALTILAHKGLVLVADRDHVVVKLQRIVTPVDDLAVVLTGVAVKLQVAIEVVVVLQYLISPKAVIDPTLGLALALDRILNLTLAAATVKLQPVVVVVAVQPRLNVAVHQRQNAQRAAIRVDLAVDPKGLIVVVQLQL